MQVANAVVKNTPPLISSPPQMLFFSFFLFMVFGISPRVVSESPVCVMGHFAAPYSPQAPRLAMVSSYSASVRSLGCFKAFLSEVNYTANFGGITRLDLS